MKTKKSNLVLGIEEWNNEVLLWRGHGGLYGVKLITCQSKSSWSDPPVLFSMWERHKVRDVL